MNSFARLAGRSSIRPRSFGSILPSTRMFTRTLRRVSLLFIIAVVGLSSSFRISALAQDEDTTPPSVEINQSEEQADPATTEPIQFTVVFSEPVVGFETGDVTLGGTAGATTAEVFDSGDQQTFFVVVSGMTTNGTVVASIAPGAAMDAAGNPNTASVSRDNTVTYNGFVVFTPLVVTKTADTADGACNADCSLREAINEANARFGADTISFDIPASDPGRNATTGVFTISLSPVLGALPQITEQVTIDGYTQGTISTPDNTSDDARPNTNSLAAGLNARLLIELTSAAGGIANANGLDVAAGGIQSRIRGLAIYGFSTGAGVNVAAGGVLGGAEGVRIEGNFLGVRADGSTVVANNYGVRVSGAQRSTTGGTTVDTSNLISGNSQAGVLITGVAAVGEDRNIVQNNLIGTNALGVAGLPNAESAAGVNRGGVLIIDAGGVLVGGAGVGNVISGNNGAGVIISTSIEVGGTTNDNAVQGNLIGVAANGTSALANSGDGIEITNGQSNFVGGTNPGEGNTISFNTANGVALTGSLVVEGGSNNNTVINNTIASNGMDGVLVVSGTGNRINGNSIYSNSQQGIDLLGDGVTPNDPNDADPVAPPNANNLQNYPVVAFAVRDTGTGVTTITGTLDGGTPDTAYRIELFANSACDGTNGEGQTPLGGVLTVAANASGDVSFSFQTSVDVSGQVITATATNETTNDTSEFSVCTAVTTAAPPPEGVPTAGQIIISEFRLRGPAPAASPTQGQLDEFIEIYNNTDTEVVVVDSSPLPPFTTNGWAIVSSDAPTTAKYVIPTGTRIPARGHYLVANNIGYSLGLYPSGNDGGVATTAIQDGGYNVDIPDDAGVALFRTANPLFFVNPVERLDAVGFAGGGVLFSEGTPLTPTGGVTASLQHSFVRKMTTGLPQDTDNNEADFDFVDVTQASVGGRPSKLGAPGPENLSSPIQRNAVIKSMYIDPQCGGFGTAASACARVRTAAGANPTNAAFGTLLIRRRFKNATNDPVTRLRFRLVDITAGTPESGAADLRALSGGDVTVTNTQGDTLEVKGLTLEELNATPPSQPGGGGLNSSLSAGTITLNTRLAAGSTIDVEFRIGVMQNGNFRYLVNFEALFAPQNTFAQPGESNLKSKETKTGGSKQQ